MAAAATAELKTRGKNVKVKVKVFEWAEQLDRVLTEKFQNTVSNSSTLSISFFLLLSAFAICICRELCSACLNVLSFFFFFHFFFFFFTFFTLHRSQNFAQSKENQLMVAVFLLLSSSFSSSSSSSNDMARSGFHSIVSIADLISFLPLFFPFLSFPSFSTAPKLSLMFLWHCT